MSAEDFTVQSYARDGGFHNVSPETLSLFLLSVFLLSVFLLSVFLLSVFPLSALWRGLRGDRDEERGVAALNEKQ